MENKTPTQARRRHIRRLRFAAGCREMLRHPAKALVLLAYLLALAWAWINRGTLLTPLSFGNSLIYHCLGFALLLVALVLLVEIIIALGTPWRAAKIQEALVAAGFVNSTRIPPMLLSVRKAAKRSYIYEFDHGNLPLSVWERDKEKIGAALRCQVVGVKLSPCALLSLRKSTGKRNICPRRILRLCLV